MLSDVTIHHANGKEKRLPTAYINKTAMELATILDSDSARGIGVKVGHKPYPFVKKSSVPVRLRHASHRKN